MHRRVLKSSPLRLSLHHNHGVVVTLCQHGEHLEPQSVKHLTLNTCSGLDLNV